MSEPPSEKGWQSATVETDFAVLSITHAACRTVLTLVRDVPQTCPCGVRWQWDGRLVNGYQDQSAGEGRTAKDPSPLMPEPPDSEEPGA